MIILINCILCIEFAGLHRISHTAMAVDSWNDTHLLPANEPQHMIDISFMAHHRLLLHERLWPCAETYARYQKSRRKVTYEYNDIIIHFYYYLSKWITNKRDQFVQKLQSTYARVQPVNMRHPAHSP